MNPTPTTPPANTTPSMGMIAFKSVGVPLMWIALGVLIGKFGLAKNRGRF